MRKIKIAVKAIAGISLAVYAVTGKVAFAISLLVFSSMALGILIGEKIDGVSK